LRVFILIFAPALVDSIPSSRFSVPVVPRVVVPRFVVRHSVVSRVVVFHSVVRQSVMSRSAVVRYFVIPRVIMSRSVAPRSNIEPRSNIAVLPPFTVSLSPFSLSSFSLPSLPSSTCSDLAFRRAEFEHDSLSAGSILLVAIASNSDSDSLFTGTSLSPTFRISVFTIRLVQKAFPSVYKKSVPIFSPAIRNTAPKVFPRIYIIPPFLFFTSLPVFTPPLPPSLPLPPFKPDLVTVAFFALLPSWAVNSLGKALDVPLNNLPLWMLQEIITFYCEKSDLHARKDALLKVLRWNLDFRV
jgi:hypothetical protein